MLKDKEKAFGQPKNLMLKDKEMASGKVFGTYLGTPKALGRVQGVRPFVGSYACTYVSIDVDCIEFALHQLKLFTLRVLSLLHIN